MGNDTCFLEMPKEALFGNAKRPFPESEFWQWREKKLYRVCYMLQYD
jgi:hypothetical protein